jgi:hypothetical protein
MAIVGIDFDGTAVTHEYPKIGRYIGAEPVLKELVAHGHLLVLWTVRGGSLLQEAVKWFEERNIPLWGVNENPEQHMWTDSKKAYCNYFIDDASLHAPLVKGLFGERAYIDWEVVRQQCVEKGLII